MLGAGVLVIAGDDGTPLFEPIEAPLDAVALGVAFRVEGWGQAGCGGHPQNPQKCRDCVPRSA